MATTERRVKVGVDVVTNVDQSSLNKIKNSFSEIQKMTYVDFANLNPTLDTKTLKAQFSELKTETAKIKSAFQDAFNVKLNTINIEEFKNKLQSINIEKFADTLKKTGSAGTTAFRQLTQDITTVNFQFEQGNKILDKFADSLKNTVR